MGTVCRAPRHQEKAPETSKTVPLLVTQAVRRAKLLHNIALLHPLTLPAPLHLDHQMHNMPHLSFLLLVPSILLQATPNLLANNNLLKHHLLPNPLQVPSRRSACQPIPGCSSIVHVDTSSKLSFKLHASPCLPSHHSPGQASCTSDWLFPRLISQRLQTFRTACFPTQ